MKSVLLFTLLVGVAWGMTRPPVSTVVSSTTSDPRSTTTRTSSTTVDPRSTTTWTSTTTVDPRSTTTPTNEVCVPDNREDVLDNPEDSEYRIPEEESRSLLTELEADGIEEERLAAEKRSTTFPTANDTSPAALWPCVTPDNNCPHVVRRLGRVRYLGPCGVEVCLPLPWYRYTYPVCRCTHCLKGRGRCVPREYRSYLVLAYCYNPHLGWRVRAVRVVLPQGGCYCRSRC